ncbi:ubiquitin-conjugating enzyme E2 S [Clonorchis sinensis]|uniref:E2 ubiquitin-conjugating enzyme n=1 Tax=Clonorchis sinensis TaxID=79923 RepID=A0A8T1MZR6_CLOSI|nr:ubiquitin-conjugating enzyme E2 S [Clonorchis sinensis]
MENRKMDLELKPSSIPPMENIYPHVVRRISKEIREVLDDTLDGIKLVVNEQDLTDIQAIIDGPADTPYEGGKFGVKLVLSERYPIEPPKGYFYTKIFHPNVAPVTGEICVDTLKRDWKSELGLKHILLVIRCLLLDPNPESALNEEAGKLLQEDYTEYVAQARLYTEIHACHHLRGLNPSSQQMLDEGAPTVHPKQSTTNTGDQNGILRDTNGPSPKKPTTQKAAQRHISAAKKALKRL